MAQTTLAYRPSKLVDTDSRFGALQDLEDDLEVGKEPTIDMLKAKIQAIKGPGSRQISGQPTVGGKEMGVVARVSPMTQARR